MSSDTSATPLTYKIKQATTTKKKAPIIVLLHGYGSNVDDLFSFAPYLPADHTIISFEAPLSLPMGGNAWYEIHFDQNQDKWSDDVQALKAIDQIMDSIAKLADRYHLDKEDITLLGFSQGAILSWATAFNYSGRIRRIVALSGYINSDLIKNPNDTPLFEAYASHGTVDPVIPFDWAKKSIEPVSKQHQNIHFYEFSDGHTVSQENFSKMVAWLESTNR